MLEFTGMGFHMFPFKKTQCLQYIHYIVTSTSSHVIIEEELVRHSKPAILSDTTIKDLLV